MKMFDLEKLKNNNAIFWVFTFPEIREVAYHCGWAIGVHGSFNEPDLFPTKEELLKSL